MATDQAERDAASEKLVPRLRRKYPSVDHVMRANTAFGERYGNHYAAAITYFSVLSLFPIMMIAFAAAGFVLAGNPELLDQLKTGIIEAAPEGLGTTINDVVDQAIESRRTVGVLGLATALYSGIGWMANLRDALTAQWGQEKQSRPLVPTLLGDLLALVGLGLALVVSFSLSAIGAGASRFVLEFLGLAGQLWARVLLTLLAVALSLAANWLVFLWVLARLPRERVAARSAVKGALIAAIGFEVLKAAATIFLAGVTKSPTGALFGPIIGLLVFANLVSRFLLFVTAWTATAQENLRRTVPPPPPVVLDQHVDVRRGPTAAEAAGLLGIGAALGWLVGLFRRR